MDALAETVRAGKVRRVGVSNYGAEQMKRAHGTGSLPTAYRSPQTRWSTATSGRRRRQASGPRSHAHRLQPDSPGPLTSKYWII